MTRLCEVCRRCPTPSRFLPRCSECERKRDNAMRRAQQDSWTRDANAALYRSIHGNNDVGQILEG